MSKNTKYEVKVNGEVKATRSAKPAAVALAESFKGEGALVEVVTSAGTVVHTIKPVTKRAKPFTRTETPKFEAPERSGYEIAYSRVRVNAVVYRALDRSADPEAAYLVLQTTTGAEFPVPNTTEARAVTNALAKHRRKALAGA